MHGEAKDARVREALNAVESQWKYQDEITKLHRDLKNAQDELKKEVEEKQATLALKAKVEQSLLDARAELQEKNKLDASTSNMHKFLRQKAEKDRDLMRAKLQKIKHICDE